MADLRRAVFDPLSPLTAGAHDQLGRLFDPVRVNSATTYVSLLERMLGVHGPLEDALGTLPWAEIGFSFDARRRAPLLVQDLAALGRGGRPIAPCPGLPACRTLAAGFGCLYVLEDRAVEDQSLGLGRVFRDSLGIRPEAGGSYFAVPPSPVGPAWRAFIGALAHYCERGARLDEAAAFALATFQAVETWVAGSAVSTGAPFVG